MSQNSENDDSDDDCEYFLQPVSNQYNITDKIKEANQELYKGEQHQRSSHPKVRFRDHQLVDFEPDEESVELMERRASISLSTNSSINTINSNIPKIKEEESSDDGYIDEEDEAVIDRVLVESIEIEEVCEQIEILDAMTVDIVETDNGAVDEENYSKDEFHEDEDESAIVTAIKIKPDKKQKKLPPQQQQQSMKAPQEKRRGSSKKVFRSKINPSVDEVMVTSTTTTSIEIIAERKSATTRKMCCQHNNGYKQKLPKYNGFFSSNYGLSKEELDRRSVNQLRNNEIQQSREVKKSEQKDHVAKVNEEAFAKWLRKKMRNTINKSNPINMYDLKPSTKEKQQRQTKRRQIQRQMETEENDDEEEEEEDEESEVFDEEET